MIVWRLGGYFVRTVSCCQRATSSIGTVNKNSSYSPIGPWVCLFMSFKLHDLPLCECMFCFILAVKSFPFMFWHWYDEPKWVPFEFFLLSPHYCRLGAAGSLFFGSIVNKRQCEKSGLLMLLVIHNWIDVQDSGCIRLEMTYIVSCGALKFTHSRLTSSLIDTVLSFHTVILAKMTTEL